MSVDVEQLAIPPQTTKGLGFAMMIHDPPQPRGMKELKVHIPVKYHLQLHKLKVLEGRQIHGVVEEALDLWFQKVNGGSRSGE